MRIKLFFLLFISQTALLLHAQSFEHITYAMTEENIGNPERGLYHQISHTNPSTLNDYVEDGYRLVLINYDLGDFKSQPISALFLRNLESDLTNIRNAGMKIIVRFAYTFHVSTPYGDAPPEIVLMHIQQLEHILSANSDVIFAVQAGFIGTWGEWYYTDYFSESPGNVSEDNWIDRRAVVDALLDVMPDDRMVQLRTPIFKREMLNEDEFLPLTEAEAYSGMPRARLGHHNDCFVANYTDYGTYQNVTVEKAYLAEDSKYVAVGGETCNPSSESHCTNSLNELERFHWTYLNRDYHQGVWNTWQEEGCATEIKKKLGYRYQLTDADLQTTARPGGHVNFSVNLSNLGWANPTNEYKVQFLLRNTADQTIYKYSMSDDLRTWALNDAHDVAVDIGMPADIPAGEYDVLLVIKDKRASLSFNPLYSIRFANENLWEATTGYNKLNHTITIGDYDYPTYTGTEFFRKEGAITTGFAAPQAMEITQYNDNCIIYWTRDATAENQVVRLQRSTDNVNFTTIATKNNDDIAFIDKNLNDNTTYYYRVQNILNDTYSEFKIASITKNNPPDKEFLYTEIDGDAADWDLVPPVLTGYQEGMTTLKLANSATDLSFFIQAPTIDNYELFFNINQESFFKIAAGSLYGKVADEWHFIKTIETENGDGFLEGSIALSDIAYDSDVYLTGQLFVNAQNVWGEDKSFYFLKYNTIQIPASFKVKPSVVTPFTKVKISWTLDSDLDGYIIERSENGSGEFYKIAELSSTNNYYLDGDLDSSIVYRYRMFGYFDIIRSGYTNVVAMDLTNPTATEDVLETITYIRLFPNPMQYKSTLAIETKEKSSIVVYLYDKSMKLIRTLYQGDIAGMVQIPIVKGDLPAGSYNIVIKNQQGKFTKTLIIF